MAASVSKYYGDRRGRQEVSLSLVYGEDIAYTI